MCVCVCVCVQGQAQECLVEKSLKGIGRVKNVTIARLATRVCSAVSKCTIIVLHVCNRVACMCVHVALGVLCCL